VFLWQTYLQVVFNRNDFAKPQNRPPSVFLPPLSTQEKRKLDPAKSLAGQGFPWIYLPGTLQNFAHSVLGASSRA
jgi:hypothetical protein